MGKIKSTESDVCYFEVDAVFNREPVELLEESAWTAGLIYTYCEPLGLHIHFKSYITTSDSRSIGLGILYECYVLPIASLISTLYRLNNSMQ